MTTQSVRIGTQEVVITPDEAEDGSFVASVLEGVETFYAEVAQHIRPWTPPPVKVRDDEPSITDSQELSGTAAAPG